MNEEKNTPTVQDIMEAYIKAFQSPEKLPQRMARLYMPHPDRPSDTWSYNNRFTVALFCESGDVRGIKQWAEVNREPINEDEVVCIICPKLVNDHDKPKKRGKYQKKLVGFKPSHGLYAYENTQGEDLPEIAEAEAHIASLPLLDKANAWGITVETFDGKRTAGDAWYSPVDGGRIGLGVKNIATWLHELVHAADDKLGTLTKRAGQQLDNEIVAQLGASTLAKALGYPDEVADLGYTWQYISGYCAHHKVKPYPTCKALLERTCKAVDLILEPMEQ
jgi:hypothetical protein